MKVLVIGNGGREHALCISVKKSPLCDELFCLPGSDAISALAECHAIDVNNNQKIIDFCLEKKITFVIIGPEVPLTIGLVDDLEKNNIVAFGPTQQGAMLEKSKIYTKEICDQHNIPTGQYKKFTNFADAHDYCNKVSFPSVIKADGLAAGKGVIIAHNLKEAQEAVSKCMKEKVFAEAGKEIIIEEFLEGEEVSLFALVDAKGFILPLTTAQDHKKINEGETGLNTGGMGAYSPIPSISNARMYELSNQFVKPVIQALQNIGITFKGMFYAGIILTKNGPKLLEINVRFGDPETQAVLPRIKSDVLKLLFNASIGELIKSSNIDWDNRCCMTVVMSTKGYPEEYPKNTAIHNLDSINLPADNYIFHSGTKRNDKQWFSDGGRVLSISSLGETINEVKGNVYSIINQIKWDGGYYRKDIGWRHTS